MTATQITPEIVQLTRFGLVNCFLVREPDGFTLVDTMISGSGPQILAQASQMPIRRILLTHAHSDHVGSLDALVQATGAEVAIGVREARLLAGDRSLDANEPQDKLRGGFPKVSSTPAVRLSPGETYGSLLAVSTPGHTPGHLAYYDPRSGTLLAGDALCSVRALRVVSDAPWYFPLPKLATWHIPTAVASAARLAELSPSIIVCGHGRPITDGTRALAAALARGASPVR